MEAVISVVAVIVAPQLAPQILMSTIGSAAGIGVTAGVLDAGMQGMAKGAGLIQSFSWEAVFNAAFSAGFMKELQTGGLSFNKQLSAMQQVALYAGLTEVSTQLAMIAIKQQKGLDIRQVLASLSQAMIDQWVNTSIPHPIPAISDPNITAEQLVERVGLDLVETAVGDAIMGSSIHLETFMANELGSNLGGRIGNPLADYLNAQSKVPAPSTQQIKQDSLSPNDAQYLKAVAAAQGQGWSPDYLEPYLGSDDPDDVFNYYLAMRDTSNSPAAQSNTRSQVTQNMLKQQANAARMQGIPVNYPSTLPNSDAMDYLLNPSASNAQSRSNAMCYVGSSLNVPDPHVAPDLLSELHDIQQNLAWKNGISVLPAPNSAARTTNNPTAQVGWFRRDVNAVSSFADELGAVLKVTSMLTTSTMTPQAADIAKVKSFAANHWQDAAVAGFVGLQFTGVGEVIDGIGAAAEGFVAGMRTAAPVVGKALQSMGFFSRGGGVVDGVGAEEVMAAPKVGDKVFRIWGDDSPAYGRSWTRTDPEVIEKYRDIAGLPDNNTGRFFSEGHLKSVEGVIQRPALPLNGNTGGLDELIVPNPQEQIELRRVLGINPEF